MPGKRPALIAAILGSALGVSAARAQDEDTPAVTPYRPSVSTPAELSAPGWLEFEGGWQRAAGAGGPARRDSLPWTAKLAFTPDWGLRVGGEAWVEQRDDSGTSLRGSSFGSIVLKRRFGIDEQSAFGLEAGVTLPWGRRGLASDKSDLTATAIYSADLGDWHTDLNLAATHLGAADPGTGTTQALWAGSLSLTLNDRWALGGELSGTHQRGLSNASQGLLSASYTVSKALVLDTGFSRGIGSSGWQVFAGFTVLGLKLF